METDNTQNQEKMEQAMIKEGAQILTPKLYNKLRDGFKKKEHKLIFDGMLYTGMRIEEFWRFIEHPEWFNYERMSIHLPRGASLKVKAKQKERDVILSALGVRIIRDLLESVREGKIKRISSRGWNDDLVRAARRSKIPLDGIIPKLARKTWISWLVAVIPEDGLRIIASSGHDANTLIANYLNTPFTPEERNEIKMHIQGWGGKSI